MKTVMKTEKVNISHLLFLLRNIHRFRFIRLHITDMAESAAVKAKSKRSYLSRTKLAPSLFQFTDLNDNCLIHVFECLDLISLAKMCKTGERFHDIITKHVIPVRLIDFSTFSDKYSVRKMFALFGKSMTRIAISEDDIQAVHPECMTGFAEFLRLLVEYGEPGKLKELELSFMGFFTVPAKILKEIGPFFANVNKLEVDVDYRFDPDFTEFMKAIDTRNIRELRLHNVILLDVWLAVGAFPSLQKLHFCFESESMLERMMNELILMEFFLAKPASLIDFECIKIPSDRIFNALSGLNPGIERLGQIEYWSNDDNNNGGGGGGAMLNGSHAKWNYLDKFTNLKDIDLKSSTANFSDLGEVFSILAKRQTIEGLHLSFGMDTSDQGHPVRFADVKRLTQLKTLHLYNSNGDRSKEFIDSLFTNLPALTSCAFVGKHPKHGRIIELIKLARNLKVLIFDCKFTTFSVRFYKKLLKCRAPADGQNQNAVGEGNRLVIHIDHGSAQKCLNELGPKRYKPSIIQIRSLHDHLQSNLN